MPDSPSFVDLVDRLQQQDEAAAAEVFHRYAGELIRLAARRLSGSLRAKVDAEDLVQSAFRSFFRTQAEQPFALGDWDSLWGVLATITLRKCGYQVRQFLTAKRNIQLEETPLVSPEDSQASWQAMAREPTPAEAAVLGDLVTQFLAGLPNKSREIAELALAGHTVAEIAPRVQLTERSVFRQMQRLRTRLEKLNAE